MVYLEKSSGYTLLSTGRAEEAEGECYTLPSMREIKKMLTALGS